jgi:hypothetical protein
MITRRVIAVAILISAIVGYLGSQALRRDRADPPSVGTSPAKLLHPSEIEKASDALRSWMEADFDEPSPLEAGERILELLPTANAREVERIAAMLKEPRYRRDPGFQLMTRIVDEHLRLRYPETGLRKQIPGGNWKQSCGYGRCAMSRRLFTRR